MRGVSKQKILSSKGKPSGPYFVQFTADPEIKKIGMLRIEITSNLRHKIATKLIPNKQLSIQERKYIVHTITILK